MGLALARLTADFERAEHVAEAMDLLAHQVRLRNRRGVLPGGAVTCLDGPERT